MAKPKAAMISKREKLIGSGVKALAEVGSDDSLSRAESTIDEALALLQSKIKSLSKVKPESLDCNELYKLSTGISAMARCSIESRRWNAERGGLLLIAEARIREELKQLLSGDPDLVRAIHDYTHEARLKIESAPLVIE